MFLSGSLNQKAIVVLGLAVVAVSLYFIIIRLWLPLIGAVLGMVFIHLAIRDHERGPGPS